MMLYWLCRMSVIITQGDEPINLEQLRFKKESELQGILEKNPYLLQSKRDPEIKYVVSEKTLHSGRFDILFVDFHGIPILVEVKLRSNRDSQSNIVGQISGYASAMKGLSFDKMNEMSGGRLEKTLREFSSDDDCLTYQERKENFDKALFNEQFKLILALDSVPNGLIRNCSFVKAHTDIDCRLISVQKYRHSLGGELLVSDYVVCDDTPSNPYEPRPQFQQLIQQFEKNKPVGVSIKERSRHTNTLITVDSWKSKDIHYEFTDWSDRSQIAVEIHIKRERYDSVKNKIALIETQLRSKIPSAKPGDPDPWIQGKWVRIQFFFEQSTYIGQIADAMKILINETKEMFSAEFEKKS